MALWVCRKCATKFAVGLPYCPQCTSTDAVEDGTPESEAVMAKISETGGVTDVNVPETMPENVSEEVEAEPEAASASAASSPTPSPDSGSATSSAASGSGEVEGPPRVNDPKSKWVEWAEGKGWTGDPDEVTKAYLIETYG